MVTSLFLFQIIFYIFAVIGMEVFQGLVNDPPTLNVSDVSNATEDGLYCGNPALKDSAFYESDYCYLNFNDVIASTLVLSTVLFENNWHSILLEIRVF